MKLSLAIQVYNGGDYWCECWESVRENLDLFEHVFISISKSPKQEKDVRLVRNALSDKVHLLRHNQEMSAVEHGIKLDNWVHSFQQEGHLFILSHDDILLRQGILELKKLDLKGTDAAFGPFCFFSQDGSTKEMIVHEFHREGNIPLSSGFFSFLQDQQQFTYNISGTVIPFSLLQPGVAPWHYLSYGCRSENCHLCNPLVKQVYQTCHPTVKIRWHIGSEGTLMQESAMQYDTLVYLLISFISFNDPMQRLQCVRSIGYTIRNASWRGLRYFLLLQFKLARFPAYYPEILKAYGYFLRIVIRKIRNRIPV